LLRKRFAGQWVFKNRLEKFDPANSLQIPIHLLGSMPIRL
jgi:hypothetical protein